MTGGGSRMNAHLDPRVSCHSRQRIDFLSAGQIIDVGVLVSMRHGDHPGPDGRVYMCRTHDFTPCAANNHPLAVYYSG